MLRAHSWHSAFALHNGNEVTYIEFNNKARTNVPRKRYEARHSSSQSSFVVRWIILLPKTNPNIQISKVGYQLIA